MLSNKSFLLLLVAVLGVYFLNLRLDVMEVDAAQYAQMSFEMMVKKNFLQPTNLGVNYLDKPPLLFWLSSLSMMLFDANNFAYKLPSLLFALLGIYSTYRFTKNYYDENIARAAALMLATAQATFLLTNDVRTDTMLMGAVIFSIWQFAEFFETSHTKNLLLGSIGVALALLTKGPIGLMTVGASIIPHLMWKKKCKLLFDIRIFLSLFLLALLLLPMSIGLYQQHGMEGLKFYFWTQSFGRITGESKWNNHPDTFFLVHSTAWQILPWSLFFFAGWITSILNLIKMRFVSWSRKEIISLSGFTFILISLSLSKYQLPHYMFVVFPLACVIAAKYFHEVFIGLQRKKFLVVIQAMILVGLLVVAVLLQYAFAGAKIFPLTSLVLLSVFSAVVFFKTRNWLIASATVAISFNILLSVFYFPEILKYQPQGEIGRYAKANEANTDLVCYRIGGDFALAFYTQKFFIPTLWEKEQLQNLMNSKRELLIYTSLEGFEELKADKISFNIIEERKKFRVANLIPQFLNPSTRDEVCDKVFLLNVSSY